MTAKEHFIGVAEVAAILGCKAVTVYKYCRERRIPHYKISNMLKFKESEIEGFIGENKVK